MKLGGFVKLVPEEVLAHAGVAESGTGSASWPECGRRVVVSVKGSISNPSD